MGGGNSDYWVVKLSSAGAIEWQNTIGGNGIDNLYSIQQTFDGGYILGGYSYSGISGDKIEDAFGTGSNKADYWVIKISSLGAIEWQNTIGGNKIDVLYSIQQTLDVGYILGGNSMSGISGDKTETNNGSIGFDNDYWVIKLNSLGDIEWQNDIGGPAQDYLRTIQQTLDGGYIVGGYSNSGIGGDKTENLIGLISIYDIWVLKLDSIGSIEWQNTIGSSGNEYLYSNSLTETVDGGFVIAGSSDGGVSGDKTEATMGGSDYWVVELNNSGAIESQNTIGGSGGDIPHYIGQTADDGFVVGGHSSSGISGDKTEVSLGSYDYWIIKIELGCAYNPEICNNIDDNCNGLTDEGLVFLDYYVDADLDGYGSNIAPAVNSCSPVAGSVLNNTDCDDAVAGIHQFLDYYVDADLDGYGSNMASPENSCLPVAGSVLNNTDCDDAVAGIHPGVAEICNSLDDNCDGLIDNGFVFLNYFPDFDEDGFGSSAIGPIASCVVIDAYTTDNSDCNDFDPEIYPGATEVINGVDDNCNFITDDILPTIEWQNTIGGSLDDNLFSVQQTTDGSFLLGGNSFSGISGDKTEINYGNSDYWIIKLNASGVVAGQNTIGGSGADVLTVLELTADGGCILGGYSNSGISGDKTEANLGGYDYWIIKLDAFGAIQWQNTIGGDDDDYLYSIEQTADNGYIIGGSSSSDISGDKTVEHYGLYTTNDYWVLKLNSEGSIEWQQNIGGTKDDNLSVVAQAPDGGYIVGGSTYSASGGNKTTGNFWKDGEDGTYINTFDYWVVKLDASGNIIWQKEFGTEGYEYLTSINVTDDGGFIVGGYGDNHDADCIWCYGNRDTEYYGIIDYWILKLDASGNIVWQKAYGGSGYSYLSTVRETEEGGFILGGYSNSGLSGVKSESAIGGYDYWIIKTNNVGIIEWQNTIGGTSIDNLYAAEQTSDGGYILGGYSSSGINGDKSEINLGGTDYWVIKLSGLCNPTPELCNSLDDNCNGLIDDGITETISISAAGPTTFCQGTNVVLTATHSGTSLQWKKNGTNIAGAINLNYTATSTGNYTCTTTSACGITTSSTIIVTVNKNPAATISAGGATTFCAGGSVILTANAGGGLSYQWYKGATAITGATSINYTATTAGNYRCRVTKIATGCFKNSNTIAVSVPCREGDNLATNTFLLYPNPAEDAITIETNSSTQKTIYITNALSQIVQTIITSENTITINLNTISSGIYFIKMEDGVNSVTQKFVKQ